MSTKQFDIHPLCAIFPDLNDSEFDDLVASITTSGVTDSIYTYKGAILDGKNRERAARKAKVVPKYIEWRPQSNRPALIEVELRDFVIAKNLRRRHLDTSQRAVIADSLATLMDGQHKVGKIADQSKVGKIADQSKVGKIADQSEVGKIADQSKVGKIADQQAASLTQDEAAELLNVSPRSVRQAREVRTEATAPIKEAVADGTVKVSDAANIAALPAAVQNAALKAVKSGEASTLTAAAHDAAIEKIRKVNATAAAEIESGEWKPTKKEVFEIAAADDVASAVREARAGRADEPEEKPKAKRGVPKDDAGDEIPENLRAAFAVREHFDWFDSIMVPKSQEHALLIQRALNPQGRNDGFRAKAVELLAKQIHDLMQKYRPRLVCKNCIGSRCTRCKGRGWK